MTDVILRCGTKRLNRVDMNHECDRQMDGHYRSSCRASLSCTAKLCMLLYDVYGCSNIEMCVTTLQQ